MVAGVRTVTTTHDLNDCENEGDRVLSNPVAFVIAQGVTYFLAARFFFAGPFWLGFAALFGLRFRSFGRVSIDPSPSVSMSIGLGTSVGLGTLRDVAIYLLLIFTRCEKAGKGKFRLTVRRQKVTLM